MHNIRTFIAAAVVAVTVIAAPARAQSEKSDAKKIDLSGKWTFTVVTENGTGTPTVTLTQKGDTVTGHYSSQTLGEQSLKGTFKDPKLTFVINAEVQGTSLTLTFTGTLEKDGSLKGSVDFGGMGGATWTGKRQ